MVEPTIIANFGEGDTGKSDSIKRVYEKLCQMAGIDPVALDKDICEVVTMNGVKIGIASDGDTQAIVRDNLDFLTNANCRIILTACRNNHDSVVLLNEYRDEYRIWRTSNARIYEEDTHPRVAPKGIQSRFNENWATEIANLIESWCYAEKE